MKIKRVLKCTSDEFYNNILRGVWEDIKENADGRTKKQDIKTGLIYTKDSKHGAAKQTITIEELTPGKCYRVSYTQNSDRMTVSYTTKEVDKGLEVTMEQIIDSYEKTKDKKSKLARKWYELVYFSRMSQTLLDFQSDIEYGRDHLKRPDESLIPKHYRKMVKSINKEVLKKSDRNALKLEQKKRIEAKKAVEKAKQKETKK